MIVIHKFLFNAECEYSGKTGEAVEFSTEDGLIKHAVISIPELTKLLRFPHPAGREAERRGCKAGEPQRELTPTRAGTARRPSFIPIRFLKKGETQHEPGSEASAVSCR